MELDDRAIAHLLDLTDEVGVLTVTTGFTPTGDAGQAARIEWKNRFREVRKTVEGGDLEALEERVAAIDDDIESLLDPRGPAGGRALVVGVASGDLLRFDVATPFADRVVLRPRPYLRPLIAALDEGRPAGIVVATKAGARVLEWSAGGVRVLSELSFELDPEVLAGEKGGPAAVNPARGQQSSSHREAFADRVDANRERFLKEVTAVVGDLARRRSWDRVVVSGSNRIGGRVEDLLDGGGVEIHTVDEAWEDASPGQVAQKVWPVLRSGHARREQRLAERVRDVAMSGGPAVMGIHRVTPASNLGRVDHLVFVRGAEVDGYVAEDGSLHASVGGTGAQADLAMEPEPFLVERVVERVLSTGGRVTRLDDEDAGREFAAYQGVGALLRW
ncbi:VLRF1 family aeRF1-type release factor [Salsipaludibacter albus]|uniref:VLRF1 family aeRF1-type release factor n=1 Tax=Salsipaludibacter albus TaxID=2849650 RepID=UPI001EE4C6C0|nr:VLRF1 family aeRF1-type release factor [Salsipaludibacter albus]MBY5163997.1 hypothetical protein [Salsipaludibacter albus]